MNLLQFSAIAVVLAAASHSIAANNAPWMVKTPLTTEPTTTTTTTESVPPTVASLGTPSKKPYPGKKTKPTKATKPTEPTELPTPSPSEAALDTTIVSLPGQELITTVREPELIEASTEAPSITSEKPLITEPPLIPSEEPSLPTEAPVETLETSPTAPAIEISVTPEIVVETTSAAVSKEIPTKEIPTEGPKVTKEQKPTTPRPTLPPIDFDCLRKDDGFYADPKDKCSRIYYACVGGLGRKLDCGSDLVFEPETSACERRQESFRCTGTRRTTVPTTPRRPPPPPVKLAIDCSKLDDGWYTDPLKKCSHTFYSCSNGIGSRFDCPGHMYFDIDSKRCQAFQDVVACAGKKPPTTKRIQTTTLPRVTEKLPIDCADKPSGQYPDPAKKCSDIYYVCSNGDGLKRSCPQGLYYHEKKQLCDFYDEIFACVGRTKPVTKPTKAPVPTIASLPSSEFKCADKIDGSYTPEGKKCSEFYFRCVGGSAFKLTCPEGLYYDVENDLCDRWMNLFDCSGRKPTSPLPITTVKPKPTEKLPIDCSKYPDGDFADPEKKCSAVYYSCSNYGGTRRLCPENTYFDKEMGICDVRSMVPDCTGKPRPLTTLPPATTRRVTIKHPYNCEKRGDGNFKAADCTDYYWSCVGGSTVRAECPHGTYYDTELDQCGYKHEIPACGGVRPTTEKP